MNIEIVSILTIIGVILIIIGFGFHTVVQVFCD